MNRTTRILAVALVASVLLNVFFVGVWAGRAVRPRREPRDASAEIWRKHDGALRVRTAAVDEARRSVRDALVAEPFDPAAMEAALAQLRTDTDTAQLALHRAFVDAARELGPEDRRRLAASRWFARGGAWRRPGAR